MNPERQKVAIAEACGWKSTRDTWYSPDGSRYARRVPHFGLDDTPSGSRDIPNEVILPDYLNDLNAMHEAEKVLTLKQRDIYVGWLMSMAVWSALTTAAQRAEAFLKTVGKWEDES